MSTGRPRLSIPGFQCSIISEKPCQEGSVSATHLITVCMFMTRLTMLFRGNYQEYKDKIPFFNDVRTFENLRIAAIKNSVQKEIMSYMNQYNQWSSGKSLYVSLKFPSIEDSDWKRAIADEGILFCPRLSGFYQGRVTVIMPSEEPAL